MPTPRRRGRWTYVSDPMNGPRWRLDGTTLDLEYDDLHSGCSVRGAWVLWLGQRCTFEPIDHYLDGSMAYVEMALDGFIVKDDSLWVRVAREQIAGERCESQGCHCTPSLPCDESGCDGRQHFDGSTVSCTMCARELAEMIEEG
jgi:hypothetical protein